MCVLHVIWRSYPFSCLGRTGEEPPGHGAPPSTASPPQQTLSQLPSPGHVLGPQRSQGHRRRGPSAKALRDAKSHSLFTATSPSPCHVASAGQRGAKTMNVTGTASGVSRRKGCLAQMGGEGRRLGMWHRIRAPRTSRGEAGKGTAGRIVPGQRNSQRSESPLVGSSVG